MSIAFRLSWQGFGHTGDVRAVTNWGDSIVTASRDSTLIVWKKKEDSREYVIDLKLVGHGGFVNSVVAYGTRENGFLVSGSQDKNIIVWNSAGTVHRLFSGHTDNVCGLHISADGGTLVSSSWDKTARVWDIASGQCTLTLPAQQTALWSAVLLQDSSIATACADKIVRIFSPQGVLLKQFSGHSDACRSLTKIPNQPNLLVSSANDGKAIVWNVGSGTKEKEIDEHDGYPVYHINANSSFLLTCCEDKTLRIFETITGNWDLQQSVPHPCVLWCCGFLPNGDLVSAGTDSVVRVWTQDNSRVAPDSEIQAYDLSIASQTVSSQMVGQIDITKLPRVEALNEPGIRPDQRKIVNNNGTAEIYQWIQSSMQWTKIGDVVNTEKAAPKTIDGKEYDFVFDVDIQEGSQPLKIGFNVGEDPWMVAQQFIWKNNLSQEFLGQIAQFVIRNVGAQNIGYSSRGFDPLTGGSRYVPGTSSRQAPTPSSSSSSSSSSSAPLYDPLGTGGYHGKAKKQTYSPQFSSQFIPLREYVVFDSGKPNEMKKKLFEFNNQVDGPVDENLLEQLTEAICNPTTHSLPLNYSQALLSLLSWPSDKMVPVLDLFRFIVRHKDALNLIIDNEEGNLLFSQILSFSGKNNTDPQRMLTMRFLANLFPSVQSRHLIYKHMAIVLSSIEGSNLLNSSPARVAFASLLQNFCVESTILQKAPFDLKVTLLQQIITFLLSEKDESIIFQISVALGTLIVGDPSLKEVIVAESSIKERILNLLQILPEGNTKKCVSDLRQLLFA